MILILFFFIKNIASSQVEIIIKPGPEEGKDAYINTFYSSGNGSTQSFIASAWTYGGVEGIGRSFIQFDLPDLPDSYSNFRATLNLFYDYSSQHVGHGGDNISKLQRITEDWNEFGIDWYNQPSVSEVNTVLIPASTNTYQDYPNIDVTDLVADMYENPTNSFGLRLSLLEESIYRSMILASSDHPDESIRPYLVISYDTCSMPVGTYNFEISNLNCQFYYNDPSVTSWQWDFGNGYGSVIQNPSYNFNEAGTYFVCLEIENTCGSITICDSVVVCDELIPTFTYVMEGLNVNFTNQTSNSDNFEFYWDFGNGFFSYLENPEFEFNYPGDYLVCLSVTNNCTTEIFCDTISVIVSNSLLGANKLLSVESFIGLFPNPAKNEVVIRNSGIEISKIEIFNSLGIFSDKVITGDFQNDYRLSLQNKVSGLYLVVFYTEFGTVTKKLVVL
jgi:PKD repeat protein